VSRGDPRGSWGYESMGAVSSSSSSLMPEVAIAASAIAASLVTT
nr:hypothetical protein [Tanacetum cinerariifolium]